MERDVFVSHASEDKATVVDELVRLLNSFQVTTWYDSQSLHVGDSLREKVDDGIANARFGVAVFSPAFFAKKWPKEELDGMFTRTTAGGSFKILPVWHEVTQDEVASYSPMIAGKVALRTADGLASVASKIRDAVLPAVRSEEPADYSQQHRNETIRVTDLPLSVNGWVTNRHFSKCHFVGPAVMTINRVLMTRVGFASPDVFFPIKVGRNYHGFIGFEDCAFVDCTFDPKVGFAVVEEYYNDVVLTVTGGPTVRIP